MWNKNRIYKMSFILISIIMIIHYIYLNSSVLLWVKDTPEQIREYMKSNDLFCNESKLLMSAGKDVGWYLIQQY